MNGFALTLIANVIYILFVSQIRSQYTEIWFDNMYSGSGWTASSNSQVLFGYSSTGCFTGKCLKTDGRYGVGAYAYRSTNVAAYSSLELQFDVSTDTLESGESCQVYYAYNSKSNKRQIKSIDPPDESRNFYFDQIATLPSAVSATTAWIWLQSTTNGDTSSTHDRCYWDNVSLRGIVDLQPTPQPTPQSTKRPTPPPVDPPRTATTQPTPSPHHSLAGVSFPHPIVADTFQGDPYGRFEASIEALVHDEENHLRVSVSCAYCFIWQYRIANAYDEWTDIAPTDDNDITVYNEQVSSDNGALYHSTLIIQSSRRLHAGYCYDADDNSRIFKPGSIYELRFQLVMPIYSDFLVIKTQSLPSGGVCLAARGGDMSTDDMLEPLQEFSLLCMDWSNHANLEYNALIQNTIMSKDGFVADAAGLTSVAPAGDMNITVLIKEKHPNAIIACDTIHVTFRSIAETIRDRLDQNPSANSEAIVREMMNNVGAMIDSTALAENPDVAISISTVIEGLYSYDSSIKPQAAVMTDALVNNIVDNSITNVQSDSDQIAGEDMITEISTIATVASHRDIVPHRTTTVLVDEYLPRVFDAMDASITRDTDETIKSQQSVLYVIAQQSQELINNLESALSHATHDEAALTMSDVNNNDLAAALVEYATLMSSKALGKSSPGESFHFETSEYNEDGSIYNKKTITATKFKASNRTDLDDIIHAKCGAGQQSIQLPPSLMTQGDGVFDCAFMSSARNHFISAQNRTEISETITVNIYGANSKYESRTSACFPYFITMESSNNLSDYNASNMDLDKPYSFPSCNFWNIDESTWDTMGCFVYNVSSTTVTCACTHLTTFSLSIDEIIPTADILADIEDWKQFTVYNFWHYPTVWLTCLSFLIIFGIICYINPRSVTIRNRTILAYEDIIYKSVQDKQLKGDIVGKVIEYLTDYMPNQHMLGLGILKVASSKEAGKSICHMQWKLYVAYLRNNHTLLSVFQRSAGTNYSLKQRLGCFFMYLCNIMMVTGIFYGWEQSTPIQDVIASFVISLGGSLPVAIMRVIFRKSKPHEVKSSKHVLYDHDIELEDQGLITASNGSTHLKALIKEQKDLTLSDFDDELNKLYGEENKQDKIRAISAIRKALFEIMFPLPNKCKTIAWIIVMIWSFATCIGAITYGFKFDLEAIKVSKQTGYESNECWNTSLTVRIDHDLSIRRFARDYATQYEKNTSSYAGGDAQSWLLSLFQSLLTSLILWQPLTIYVVTWMKLWLFSWHLQMELSRRNIVRLCKRCCCGYVDIHSRLVKLGSVNHQAQRRKSRKMRDVIAHKNRPMDIISFLGNERWMIDDTNDDAVEVELCIEEGEEEENEDMIMNDGMKDVCNDCGLLRIGKIYELDQLFYCLECWRAYE
eukprot:32733_1